MGKKRIVTSLTAVLAVVVLAGLVFWIMQTANGLGFTTGLNNSMSWGAYIVTFVLFVGLSAGGLIVAASAEVFDIESFKSISLPAVLLSTVCICAAGLLVLLDLGSIKNILGIIVHPNPTSPLFWDVCIITCYLVLNIVELCVLLRGGSDRTKKTVACVTLPVAVLVHSVTAWIFGLQIAKAGWFSALMAPLFVASALDSGLGLLIVVLLILDARGLFAVDAELFPKLGKLMATCLAIDGYMIFCECLTMGYPGDEAAMQVLGSMLHGSAAPFFWFEILCGIVLPFVLLFSRKRRENRAVLATAGVLAVLGVFAKRIWLVTTSLGVQNVDGALGVTTGSELYANWVQGGTYALQPMETVVVLGVMALAALAFIVIGKLTFFNETEVDSAA